MKSIKVRKEDSLRELKAATVWEKVFLKHIFDKGLVSKIHKELLSKHTPK